MSTEKIFELLSLDSESFYNRRIQKKIIKILQLIAKLSPLYSRSASVALRKTCIDILGSEIMNEISRNIPEITADRSTVLLHSLTSLTQCLTNQENDSGSVRWSSVSSMVGRILLFILIDF